MANALVMDITSDLKGLKEALNIIPTQIKNKKPFIPDEDLTDLRLIFSELLSNAIIHGNKYDTYKKVHIIVEFADDNITAKITDEGNGFNYTEILKLINAGEDFLSETGRGIKLAVALTDELVFNGIGNDIIFLKKLVNMTLENTTGHKNCLRALKV